MIWILAITMIALAIVLGVRWTDDYSRPLIVYPGIPLALFIGALIVAGIGVCLAAEADAAVREQAWQAWSRQHQCRLIRVTSGETETHTTYMTGANGELMAVPTTVNVPRSSCYACNDGVEHCRHYGDAP